MRPLKEQYNKNGYSHKLIWRDGDYAITEAYDVDDNKVRFYESFEIIKNVLAKSGSFMKEDFESTPSNEQWGVKGYTSWTLEEAKNKIEKLKARKDGRQ